MIFEFVLKPIFVFTVISVNEGLVKVYKYFDDALKGRKAKLVYDAVGDGLMYLAADL